MARTRISGTEPHRRVPRPHGAADGFTLLELLVVLAIIAVITAVVLPNLKIPGFASGAAKAAREIASELATARQRAIFAGQPVGLFIDVDTGTIRVGNDPSHRPTGIKRLSIVTTARSVRDASTGAIRFFPDGSSDGGEIVVTGDRGATARIRINWLTGRIEVLT